MIREWNSHKFIRLRLITKLSFNDIWSGRAHIFSTRKKVTGCPQMEISTVFTVYTFLEHSAHKNQVCKNEFTQPYFELHARSVIFHILLKLWSNLRFCRMEVVLEILFYFILFLFIYRKGREKTNNPIPLTRCGQRDDPKQMMNVPMKVGKISK